MAELIKISWASKSHKNSKNSIDSNQDWNVSDYSGDELAFLE